MKNILISSALCLASLTLLSAQDSPYPLIEAKAPSLIASTTNGKIHFPEDYGNSWKVSKEAWYQERPEAY